MSDHAAIEREITSLLGQDHLRLTPTALFHLVRARCPGIDRAAFRSVVKMLVDSGDLAYTSQLCTSHLELGRAAASHVSDGLKLSIGEVGAALDPARLLLKLKPGAAFGSGDHPTTRLALRGLSHIIAVCKDRCVFSNSVALDIGTGSGVLAIAAAMLQMGTVVALDIDPMACHEAAENVRLNGVQGDVAVVCGYLDALSLVEIKLVLANLRPPTLAGLMPVMATLTQCDGHWVLSGFRPGEAERLKRHFPPNATVIWEEKERNWAAMVVHIG